MTSDIILSGGVSDVELAEVYHAGNLNYPVGHFINGTEAAQLYDHYKRAPVGRCITCQLPLVLWGIGVPPDKRIQTPYFRRDDRHKHQSGCRFSRETHTGKKQDQFTIAPKPEYFEELIAPSKPIKRKQANMSKQQHTLASNDKKVHNQKKRTDLLSNICQNYIDISDINPSHTKWKLALTQFSIKLPHRKQRLTYKDSFVGFYKNYSKSHIFHGLANHIFWCSDGLLILIEPWQEHHAPAMVIIPQAMLSDPNWGQSLQTHLKRDLSAFPCVYIYGRRTKKGSLHVIKLQSPTWLHFDVHPRGYTCRPKQYQEYRSLEELLFDPQLIHLATHGNQNYLEVDGLKDKNSFEAKESQSLESLNTPQKENTKQLSQEAPIKEDINDLHDVNQAKKSPTKKLPRYVLFFRKIISFFRNIINKK